MLGTALAIKMIAYIGVAPVVGAFANKLPRRAFLAAMREGELRWCEVALTGLAKHSCQEGAIS